VWVHERVGLTAGCRRAYRIEHDILRGDLGFGRCFDRRTRNHFGGFVEVEFVREAC